MNVDIAWTSYLMRHSVQAETFEWGATWLLLADKNVCLRSSALSPAFIPKLFSLELHAQLMSTPLNPHTAALSIHL